MSPSPSASSPPACATANTHPVTSIRFISIALLVAALGLLVWSRFTPPAGPLAPASVRIGGHTYAVELAASPAQQQRGLSGRDWLAPGTGMAFPFDPPAFTPFWMQEMHFAIDIVWVANGKVVGVAASVAPDRPGDEPRLYYPPVPVSLVVELPAGTAAADGLAVGDAVSLEASIL
jgi:uncharacterized membrane protein (UPF0127 family)